MNNAVHASMGYTPFYVNELTHPRTPLAIPRGVSGLGVEELADALAGVSPKTVQQQVDTSSVLASVSLDTWVTPWLRAKIFKNNKLMQKEEEPC